MIKKEKDKIQQQQASILQAKKLLQQEKEDIPEVHDTNYLTLEETVANVKHYGLFKIILKCLFC